MIEVKEDLIKGEHFKIGIKFQNLQDELLVMNFKTQCEAKMI